MPSSYTSSARFTLQATGENNNTWGVILNSGVFQLVDDTVNGRLGFVLSGPKVLTTNLGATDEARMAFLDVTGGTGGLITVPAVSKGYMIRNAAAGAVTITAGGAVNSVFAAGDVGPVFTDGAAVYGLQLAGQPLGTYITAQVAAINAAWQAGDAALYTYINAAITSGVASLPPAAGQTGKALIVRGTSPAIWTADFIQLADVQGAQTYIDAGDAAASDLAVAWALTL